MSALLWLIRGRNARVKVDFRPLEKYLDDLTKAGKVREEVLSAMVYRYMQFSHKRYTRLSNRKGEWPPLSKSTKKRYSKGRRRILVDSGTLKTSLKPHRKQKRLGTQTVAINNGVRFGFSRETHVPSGLTFQRLAKIHTRGLGRNPKRVILVKPDDETQETMKDDVVKIALKLKKRLGMK